MFQQNWPTVTPASCMKQRRLVKGEAWPDGSNWVSPWRFHVHRDRSNRRLLSLELHFVSKSPHWGQRSVCQVSAGHADGKWKTNAAVSQDRAAVLHLMVAATSQVSKYLYIWETYSMTLCQSGRSVLSSSSMSCGRETRQHFTSHSQRDGNVAKTFHFYFHGKMIKSIP